ncbi:MAG: hypothetical protein JNM69_37250 [Archangium sp.]|nr:hypothetical protein [Archangium sp.]
MKRLGLLTVLALIGCRSSIDLSGGRAYACSRDGGVTGCTSGWLCGDDLRCFDPDAGLARACETAQTGCGGGWKCGFDKVCFDPSVVDGPVRGCSDPRLHCPTGWHCGFDNTCFDPARFDGPRRACADPLLHCPQGWRCGIDRLCFDPAEAMADGGARQCTDPALHCSTNERCGLDGLCFTPVRSPDAGAGPDCVRDDQCPTDWRCGIEDVDRRRRCQPIGVGGPWACRTDSHCEGWRCNPVELRCTAPPTPPLPTALSGFVLTHLSPLLDAGVPSAFSISGAFGSNGTGRSIVSADSSAVRLFTRLTDPLPLPDGGSSQILSRVEPWPAAQLEDLIAGPQQAWVLFRDGGLAMLSTADGGTSFVSMPGFSSAKERLLRRFDGRPVALWRNPDAGTVTQVMLDEPPAPLVWNDSLCALAFSGSPGRLVDVALHNRQLIELFEHGYCLQTGSTPATTFFREFDAGVATRLLVDPQGGANVTGHLAFELVVDGGARRYFSTVIRNDPMGITPTQNAGPCPVCPGGLDPEFVMNLEGTRDGTGPALLARCPAATLMDAGVATGTWIISPRSGPTCQWSFDRVFDEDGTTPFRDPFVSRASQANQPAIAASHGRAWYWQTPGDPLDPAPGGLVPWLLDRTVDVGARVFVGGQERLFFISRNTLFAFDEQLGFHAQNQFPTAFAPIASVTGQRAWVVSATQIYDGRPQVVQTDTPPAVAIPPTGRLFGTPASGVLQGELLVIAAADTLYVGNVKQNLISSLNPPTELRVAAVPAPGLPIRSVAAQEPTDGGVTSVWAVTDTGVFLSTSDDLRRWTSVRVPLGPFEGAAIATWATPQGAFALTNSGLVLSLPTAVPVSVSAGGALIDSARVCRATVALVQQPGGLVLSVLQGSADGGLATWSAGQMLDVTTAKLLSTGDELYVSTSTGRVTGAKPVLTGPCE